jgi:hypothetical protein
VSCCTDVQGLLGRYVDRELPPADVNRVDNHLTVCDDCAGRVRLMEREAELLRAAFEPEDVPESAGADVWPRMQRLRAQRRRLRWYGLAAAASILLALGARLALLPGPAPAEIVRVTGCSGPVELRRGRGWSELATYTVLRDGDRVRCARGGGSVTLHGGWRMDLRVDSEIAFEANGAYSPFSVHLLRGAVHVELPRVRQPLNVRTPVGQVTAFSEVAGVPGPARFELVLTGTPPAVGWLERLDPTPVAYAGPATPELEVVCYEGSVRVVNTSGEQVAVQSGQRAVIAPTGPITQPTTAEARSRPAWWSGSRGGAAPAPPLPLPLPPVPEPVAAHVTPDPTRTDPDDARKTDPPDGPPDAAAARDPGGEPDPPAPLPRSMEGPPPPADFAAASDFGAVILTWSPITWREPIVEYNVYRRAPQDTEFALIARVPAQAAIRRYVYRDAGLMMGEANQYAVASVVSDDERELHEGAFSKIVTGRAADYAIYFTGIGKAEGRDQAMILVEKRHRGTVHRHTFAVPPRDLHLGTTGEIGGPRQIVVEPMPSVRHRQLVDFSTGYRLLRIQSELEMRAGLPRERRSILIENALGTRREIPLRRAAAR